MGGLGGLVKGITGVVMDSPRPWLCENASPDIGLGFPVAVWLGLQNSGNMIVRPNLGNRFDQLLGAYQIDHSLDVVC